MNLGNHTVFVDLGLNRQMREKRSSVRKPVRARVRITHSTFGVIRAWTRNISDRGVYVELREQPHLPIGAHIKLQMLDSAMPEIAFNMKVERTDDEGISLSFVDYEIHGERHSMESLRDIWQRQARLTS